MASFFLRLSDASSPRGAHAALQGDLDARAPRISALRGINPPLEHGHFLCRDDRALPLYGKMKDAPNGLYLGLLHGRNQLDTPLDGLGYPGPAIGPLCHVRTAYAAHLYLRFADPATSRLFFPAPSAMEAEDALIGLQDEVVIDIVNSTIPFDGRFFGDWMVFYHGESSAEQ
ncbi:hypothetical protein [Paraburkholderia sp. BCC1885]|uniref:hypothetical protein n=1 Tax=Paraburkholderia sp. BCC1885 TaxID=2562669 RepID=UPI001183F0BE|nr:hypothetical protein [Paraburkholderia sp. BCC1885]